MTTTRLNELRSDVRDNNGAKPMAYRHVPKSEKPDYPPLRKVREPATDFHRQPQVIWRLTSAQSRAIGSKRDKGWTGNGTSITDKMYARAGKLADESGGLVHVVDHLGYIIATV